MNKDKSFKKSLNKYNNLYRFRMFNPETNKNSYITYDEDQAVIIKSKNFKQERNLNYETVYYEFTPIAYKPYFLWRFFWFLKSSLNNLRSKYVQIIARINPVKNIIISGKFIGWLITIIAALLYIIWFINNN